MDMTIQDVLSVTGASVVILIVIGAAKSALPTFQWDRFGAVLSIALGVAIVSAFNATALADVRLAWPAAVLTGILAGAAASGLYEAGKGARQ